MTHIGLGLKEIDGAIQDLYLDPIGNLVFVEDAEAVGQHVKQRTKTFKGEWFLNSNIGVPWLTDILGKAYNPALAEAIIKSVVKKTDGVTEIVSFSVRFDKTKRQLAASSISIKTIYDQVVDL